MSERSKPPNDGSQTNNGTRSEQGPDPLENWPSIGLDDDVVAQKDARVGQRLRLRREMLGLRQVDLAGLCKMSAQQIHKYENGDSKLNSARLVQFAQVLDVRVGWFFGEDDEDSDQPNAFVELLCERVHMEVLIQLSRINSAERKEWIGQVVKTLSEDVLAEREQVDPINPTDTLKPVKE